MASNLIGNLERGDIVWIDFSSTKNSESRPALVISPEKYNSISGMVLVCPIKNKSVDYFFEVEIDLLELSKEKHFVLVDQIRSFDINKQVKKKTGNISPKEMDEVIAKMDILVR